MGDLMKDPKTMKILLATAERDWTYARTRLFAELTDQDNSPDG